MSSIHFVIVAAVATFFTPRSARLPQGLPQAHLRPQALMEAGDSSSRSPRSRLRDPGAASERTRRMLSQVLGAGSLVMVAAAATHLAIGSGIWALAGTLPATLLLLLTWGLVHQGKVRTATYLFPSAGWTLTNITILMSPDSSPLLLAGVNSIVTLLAATLIGPAGVLLLGSMTGLLGLALAALDLLNLIPPDIMAPTTPTLWIAAGATYSLVSLFAYFAIRQQRMDALEADRRAEQLATLAAAAAAITASLERDETMQRILEQLERVVPYDSASVQILGDGYLEIVGGRGLESTESVLGLRFPVPDDNPNTVVLQTCQPYILDNAPAGHKPFRHPPHDHIRSWLGVPLILGDRLVGMLSLDSSMPSHFDEEHARVVSAFADHVAIALENARLHEAEQHRHRMTTIQHDITQVTSSSLDLDTVLLRVARLTASATGADRALILLRDERSDQLELASGQTQNESMPEDELEQLRTAGLSPADVFLSEIAQTYEAILAGPGGDGHELPPLWQAIGAHHALVAPLLTHQQLLGAMVLLHLRAEASFSDEQIDLAQTVAISVSASVENALLYAQVEEMALTDSLTGLYNRRGLAQMAAREIEFVRRYQRPLSVLMLDLDHFKRLNDNHGHNIGDQVLVGLADRLRASLRSVDTISRHGGEEFVVLLPECDLASAEGAAERARSAVEARPFATDAGQLPITVSAGVTCAIDSSDSLAVLVDRADQAMYAAKQAGRNQVWSWGPEQPEPSSAV